MSFPPTPAPLGWLGIFRLGLVQVSLGSVVVLCTSVFNRVMTVEYALFAIVPGLQMGWREALQFLRPRWGYGSDAGGRRTPWIRGGIAVLALGGLVAALGIALMDANTPLVPGFAMPLWGALVIVFDRSFFA